MLTLLSGRRHRVDHRRGRPAGATRAGRRVVTTAVAVKLLSRPRARRLPRHRATGAARRLLRHPGPLRRAHPLDQRLASPASWAFPWTETPGPPHPLRGRPERSE
jgi:hypothetical protein